MEINSSIFKAYDVRGLYPQEFNESAAYAIARAAALFLHAERMVVAMDNRATSPSLKEAVLRACEDAGVNVTDAGVTTTPLFYFAVNTARADGGIMITASHNPPQYNGLKITSKSARPVGENSGLQEIKTAALAGAGKFSKGYADGSYVKRDYVKAYVDFLLQGVSIPDITVAVDAACGYAGTIMQEIAKRTNIRTKNICFPPCEECAHGADPLKDENVRDIAAALQSGAGEFGAAFDGDGDRIFFFDKNGGRIPSHAAGAMLARYYLKRYPGAAIISDVRMPKIFAETVMENGGRHLESRVGHAFIKQLMRKEGAVFAAEVSGHFYFKDFFGADSGLYAFTRILDIIAREKKSLAELAMPYMKRFQSGEINFKVADTAAALAAAEKEFAGGNFTRADGLSVYFSGWWCNIRPSNTEPFLRVNIEAETLQKLLEIKEKIEKILNKNNSKRKVQSSNAK